MKIMHWQVVRESAGRHIRMVPTLLTLCNALCGFFAIIQAYAGEFHMAALCVVAAAFADVFDGMLARALHSNNQIGAMLDSLCDGISFCLAPVVVLYQWVLVEQGYIGIATACFYLCAGLFRLARFTATETSEPNNGALFRGLPTPVAALCCMGLVLYATASDMFYLVSLRADLVHGLVITLGLLMLSRVPYPSTRSVYRMLSAHHFFWWLLGILLLFMVLYWHDISILLGSIVYILWGIIHHNYLVRLPGACHFE